MLPSGAVNIGERLGLPSLPVVPPTRVKDGRARDALAAPVAIFRSAVERERMRRAAGHVREARSRHEH